MTEIGVTVGALFTAILGFFGGGAVGLVLGLPISFAWGIATQDPNEPPKSLHEEDEDFFGPVMLTMWACALGAFFVFGGAVAVSNVFRFVCSVVAFIWYWRNEKRHHTIEIRGMLVDARRRTEKDRLDHRRVMSEKERRKRAAMREMRRAAGKCDDDCD